MVSSDETVRELLPHQGHPGWVREYCPVLREESSLRPGHQAPRKGHRLFLGYLLVSS